MISINWQAVEALATVGALIFLGFQLIQFRKEITARNQEITARKIEGFKYARGQLESTEFRNWFKAIIMVWRGGKGTEYPKAIERDINNALTSIDFVAQLIELDYVDRDLLFSLFADDLMILDHAITDLDQRDNSRIPELRVRFPRGFALLNEASIVSDDEELEILEKLFVD